MRSIFTLAIVLLTAALCPAQPLADRVPADSMIYIGWSGTDNIPGYAGTHAEALIQQSGLPAVFQQVLPQALAKAKQKNPNDAQEMQFAYDIVNTLRRKPTAVFFAGLSMPQGERGQPLPRLGVVCRAGADAEPIRAKLQAIIDKEGDPDVPVRVVADGQDVAMLIGYDADESPLSAGGGLVGAASFASAVKQVQPTAAACAFVDVEKLFELIDTVVTEHADPEQQGMYQKVVDALGVRGLKHAIFTSGFDGKDWMGRSFVAAPAPRSGLLAMLDGPDLSDDLLRTIPFDAEIAAAGSFDAAKLITELRSIAGKVDPQYQTFFDQGLGAVQMAIGTNLQTGVLEPLGSHWVGYSASGVSGGGLAGLVLINKADNAEQAKRGLMSLSLFASNSAGIALRDQEITIQGRQVKVGDLAINYVAVPLVTPCWSVSGDYAMFGLYPQSIIDANKHIASGGKSIVDNPDYQKLRERLGQKSVRGVYFANLPKTAPNSYGLLLALSRIVGVADLFGIQSPPIVIPPYSVFAEHLTPAGGVTWVDDAGLHAKVIEPFPGAGLFQGSAGALPVIIGQSAMMAGITAPAFGRARMQAREARDLSDLRQIGVGIIISSNDNAGKLPADMNAIVQGGYLTRDFFDQIGPDRDFQYLGDGNVSLAKIQEPSRVVLVYDAAAMGQGRRVPAVYADGHAQWLRPHEVEQVIEASRAALEAARD